MPNLREWIEAQLKRGYTRKQINNALIRKGYSPKAVAEVDKIAGLNKKTPSSQNIKAVILVISIIIAIVLYFSGAKFGAEKDFLSLQEAVNKSGYSEGYLEQLAKEGKIGTKSEGDRIFISTKDLEKHMQEIKQVPKALQPQPPKGLQPPKIVPLNEPEVPGVLHDKGVLVSEPAPNLTRLAPLASKATKIESSAPRATPIESSP